MTDTWHTGARRNFGTGRRASAGAAAADDPWRSVAVVDNRVEDVRRGENWRKKGEASEM